jgi:hypothetical protein
MMCDVLLRGLRSSHYFRNAHTKQLPTRGTQCIEQKLALPSYLFLFASCAYSRLSTFKYDIVRRWSTFLVLTRRVIAATFAYFELPMAIAGVSGWRGAG